MENGFILPMTGPVNFLINIARLCNSINGGGFHISENELETVLSLGIDYINSDIEINRRGLKNVLIILVENYASEKEYLLGIKYGLKMSRVFKITNTFPKSEKYSSKPEVFDGNIIDYVEMMRLSSAKSVYEDDVIAMLKKLMDK